VEEARVPPAISVSRGTTELLPVVGRRRGFGHLAQLFLGGAEAHKRIRSIESGPHDAHLVGSAREQETPLRWFVVIGKRHCTYENAGDSRRDELSDSREGSAPASDERVCYAGEWASGRDHHGRKVCTHTLVGGGDEHGMRGPVPEEMESIVGPHVDEPKTQLARARAHVISRLPIACLSARMCQRGG
jgi:hypothetical protein